MQSRLLDGRLTLRHMRLVDALSERGSVIGAAAALHDTQPVVTRGLHDLETILGVTLYDRGPRGIVATEFGTAFTEHARAVLAQLTQAVRHVEEIADATRGRVVVGTHLAGSNLLLPRAIVHLKREHPNLGLTVREGSPESLLVELTAGRVDVVVGRLGGPGSEGVRRTPLYEETIQVVTGVGHPLVDQPDLTLDDLGGYPWILPGSETRLRHELEAHFARHDFELPPSQIETTSFLTIRQLLIETDMIATLPGLIGADDPRLATLGYQLENIGDSIGMTLAADRRLSPATQALITSLRAVASHIAAG